MARGFALNLGGGIDLSSILNRGNAATGKLLQLVDGRTLIGDPGIEAWSQGRLAGIEGLTSGILTGGRELAAGGKEGIIRADRKEQQEVENAMAEKRLALSEFNAAEALKLKAGQSEQTAETQRLRNALLEKELTTPDKKIPTGEDYTKFGSSTVEGDITPEELKAQSETNSQLDSQLLASPVPLDMLKQSADPELPLADAPLSPESNPVIPDGQPSPGAAQSPFQIFDVPGDDGKPSGIKVLVDKVTGKHQMVPASSLKDMEVASAAPVIPPGMVPKGVTINADGKMSTTYEPEGGKQKKDKLLQDQMKIMTAIEGVTGTLGTIEEAVKNIKARGPIAGAIRGKNPYDVEAQRLEALVNSLTPGLARGVFGEVGVLTDKDIERYKKLIPNIATDPSVADVILKDLKKKLIDTRKANIRVWSASGYDTEGLEKMYGEAEKGEKEFGEAESAVRNAFQAVVSAASPEERKKALAALKEKSVPFIKLGGNINAIVNPASSQP